LGDVDELPAGVGGAVRSVERVEVTHVRVGEFEVEELGVRANAVLAAPLSQQLAPHLLAVLCLSNVGRRRRGGRLVDVPEVVVEFVGP
jgi:hypothetical protein